MNGSGRFEHRVRVLSHLDGESTRVTLEATGGLQGPDGGPWWTVPTRVIPPHLRPIGSRFLLQGRSADPKQSAEEIRQALSSPTVRELPADWLPMTAETPTATFSLEEVIDLTGRGPVLLGRLLGGILQPGMVSEPLPLPAGSLRLTLRSVEIADNVSALNFRFGLLLEQPPPASELTAVVGRDLLFGPSSQNRGSV